MPKQLTKKEWLYFFDLYEKNRFLFKLEYSNRRNKKINKDLMRWFLRKYHNYKYNKNVMELKSKTGKSPKKGKGSGRPKKEKIDINKGFPNTEIKNEFIEWIIENIKNGKVKIDDEETLKEFIKKTKFSCREVSNIVNISKSHISRIRNGWKKKEKENTKDWYYLVKFLFFSYKEVIGREPITAYLYKFYNIKKSDRQVGRAMKSMGLVCKIRKPKRIKESKNTDVSIQDLVNRDYNNKFHDEHIVATDVSYIKAPIDVFSNHVYLSICYSHKYKKILSWKLSKFNDTELVISTIRNLKIDNAIIHSDHGSVYSSVEFQNEIKSKNWKQSMGAVGKSVDNREVEHVFGVLKTEIINRLDFNKITFKDLLNIIDEYVCYYNNERIQKNLGWLSPNQYIIESLKNGVVPF